MRKSIFVFVLSLICISGFAQKPTKEERKAIREQRRAEREEYYRIQDSLFCEEKHRQDSIWHEERKREGATAIQALSPISPSEALDRIARALIKFGYVLRVDKEYGTINTEPKWGNGASYTLHYVIEQHPEGCIAKGFATAHGQVNTFHSGLGFGYSKTLDVRIEYGGSKNSPSMIAFRELYNYLTALPKTIITYYRDEAYIP